MLLRHIGLIGKADILDNALSICTEIEKKVIADGTAQGATAEEFSDYVISVIEKIS